jgi:hypothetical protein
MNADDQTDEHNIKYTTFLGQFKHVIRLCYPCGRFEDAKAPHGEPPTLEIIANLLAEHRKECRDCF